MTNKEQEEIVYPIRIKKKLWEDFKIIIPRNKTLNNAIIELIKKEIEEEKNE